MCITYKSQWVGNVVFQTSDSTSSLAAAGGTLVDHSRSQSAASSDDRASHRTSGYLQPLVSNSSGAAGHPIKYLQLLNTSAASSTPQLTAIRRHATADRARDDRRRRPDYAPLVCDANDSSATSLATAGAAVYDSQRSMTDSFSLRPGPSPIYGRRTTSERRVQSMNCDATD